MEELGGNATSRVSSETDYVAVEENPGSTYDDARDQGVNIIDEERFKKMLK